MAKVEVDFDVCEANALCEAMAPSSSENFFTSAATSRCLAAIVVA